MKKTALLLLILLLISVSIAFAYILKKGTNYASNIKKTSINARTAKPQISAWAAWWKEEDAYKALENNPGKISTLSPVWFMVNADFKLEEVGLTNKGENVEKLKSWKIKVAPSIGSSLSSEKLGGLFKNIKRQEVLISEIASVAAELEVDGIDIDLENIRQQDRDKFTRFLSNLKKELSKNNIKMSVAVLAQTGVITWEQVLGQDLEAIGKIADEVRIMAYDEHAPGTDQGPISSFSYLKKVAAYNLLKIPKEKIVIGIPTYGYIWTKDNTTGFQYDEFQEFLAGKEYTKKRDKKSGELVFESDEFSGWLSDAIAMREKINLLRTYGFSRFVIWHLGGVDPNFFLIDW